VLTLPLLVMDLEKLFSTKLRTFLGFVSLRYLIYVIFGVVE
jgi:hypothetical protein